MILSDVSLLGITHLTAITDHSWLSLSFHDLTNNMLHLAQSASTLKSIDIIADFQKAFKNFIESGQVWALGIGIVVGWLAHTFIGS